MADLSVNLDLHRLQGFHQVLINQTRENGGDELTQIAWQESDKRREKALREERRQDWIRHYRRLALILTHIAEEHEQKAVALEEGER